jgi:hypothetical protein
VDSRKIKCFKICTVLFTPLNIAHSCENFFYHSFKCKSYILLKILGKDVFDSRFIIQSNDDNDYDDDDDDDDNDDNNNNNTITNIFKKLFLT